MKNIAAMQPTVRKATNQRLWLALAETKMAKAQIQVVVG
jgi:hypothetical protein